MSSQRKNSNEEKHGDLRENLSGMNNTEKTKILHKFEKTTRNVNLCF